MLLISKLRCIVSQFLLTYLFILFKNAIINVLTPHISKNVKNLTWQLRFLDKYAKSVYPIMIILHIV